MKFLDDWIVGAAQGPQRTESRLRIIELWVTDQKTRKKKNANAAAANKTGKARVTTKKRGRGGLESGGDNTGGDDPNGGGPNGGGLDGDDIGGDSTGGDSTGGDNIGGDSTGGDSLNGGGLDGDDTDGDGIGGDGIGGDGQHGDRASGHGIGGDGQHGDGASGTGGDNDGGSASGGDENRSDDGGGNNSGEADNGRAHGSQDGQEGTGHHDGRNDLLGEQVQENQPREDHVQNSRQGDGQGDGLTEQPQDRRQGEDGVLAGAQAVVQSGTQGGVKNSSDILGNDNGPDQEQDNGQGDVPTDDLQRPQRDSQGQGDEPEHNPQPNRQLLNPQDNIPPTDTSPKNHSGESGAQDNTAQTSDHQASVEDLDDLHTPGNAYESSRSLAAGRYTGGPLRVQGPAPSSIPSQTPAKIPPPGTVQTPVVSVPRPNSSPLSPCSRDAQGLDSLLTATQLPNPLRLTSRLPDKEFLCRTVRLLFAMPGNDQLSRVRRGDITSFVGSLFDKASYWALHNNMLRQVEKTGFRTESADGLDIDRRDSMASFASSRTPSVDSQSDSGLKAPPFLTMFAEQWRGFLQFSYQTSSTAAVRLTRMKHEEQCYLHWCTLKALWKASDPGRDHNNSHDNTNVDDSEGEEDGALPRTTAHLEYTDPEAIQRDSRALLQFLTDQMEQRKPELNLRRSPQHEAHTVRLLKTLVAPFLGLTATENLWRKTMTIGRSVHAISRGLGAGALVLVKRET